MALLQRRIFLRECLYKRRFRGTWLFCDTFPSFLSNQDHDTESEGGGSEAPDAEVPNERRPLGLGGQEYGVVSSREGLVSESSWWCTTEATFSSQALVIGYHGNGTIGSTSELDLVLTKLMRELSRYKMLVVSASPDILPLIQVLSALALHNSNVL